MPMVMNRRMDRFEENDKAKEFEKAEKAA